MNFGVLTFSQDTFSGVGSKNAEVIVSGLEANITLDTNINVQGGVAVPINGLTLTGSVNSNLTFQGSAEFTIGSVSASLGFGQIVIGGGVNTPEAAFEITGSVNPNLTFVGNASFELGSVSASTAGSLSSIQIEGDANVSVAVLISSNQTNITTGITSTLQVDTSANVLLSLFDSNARFDSATFDSDIYNSTGYGLVGAVGQVVSQGIAEITLSTPAELSIGYNPPVICSGDANTPEASFNITGSVGNLAFIGDASIVIDSVSATVEINPATVQGNAEVIITGLEIVSGFETSYQVISFSADSYSRERVVYVDFKDNHINNTVSIEEQDRTVYIDQRPHLVSSVISIPEQNRVVYIREKQHEMQSRIAKAA